MPFTRDFFSLIATKQTRVNRGFIESRFRNVSFDFIHAFLKEARAELGRMRNSTLVNLGHIDQISRLDFQCIVFLSMEEKNAK